MQPAPQALQIIETASTTELAAAMARRRMLMEDLPIPKGTETRRLRSVLLD